ncbi:MAG: MarR family transcriptional regulator [Micrococcaceae bacterium]|jgi:DNA-binding MarR family transcriptional regulator|nr:MarR family transcriptional regulator [Micrococcaceae bacterium]
MTPDTADRVRATDGVGATEALDSLEHQIDVLVNLDRGLSDRRTRLFDLDLESTAHRILVILEAGPAVVQEDLVVLLGIEASGVSKQVTKLEKLRLVQRDLNPLNHRRVAVSLTPAGVEHLCHLRVERRDLFKKVVATWAIGDVEKLTLLVARFNSSATIDVWQANQ